MVHVRNIRQSRRAVKHWHTLGLKLSILSNLRGRKLALRTIARGCSDGYHLWTFAAHLEERATEVACEHPPVHFALALELSSGPDLVPVAKPDGKADIGQGVCAGNLSVLSRN